jgi:hypothetical protein
MKTLNLRLSLIAASLCASSAYANERELPKVAERLLQLVESQLGKQLPQIEGLMEELFKDQAGSTEGAEPRGLNSPNVDRLRSFAEEFRRGSGSFQMSAPVEKGNPYSAREQRDFKQSLPDGNQISRSATRLLARDGEGRTRQELRQADGTARVFINDPVARVTYIVDPQKKTVCKAGFESRAIFDCFERMRGDWKPMGFGFNATSRDGIAIMQYSGGGGASPGAAFSFAMPSMDGARIHISRSGDEASSGGPMTIQIPRPEGRLSGQGAMVSGSKQNTERSTQAYEGLNVEVTKSSETIPAGAVGNSKAIESVRERFYSPELKMTVFSRSADPRSGEQIYKLTDIKRSEPDAALFKAPAGFAEIEGKAK